ncbi:T9SS response regulator signal transducer PorX [Prevotella sp.]|uniref:T9SS response regulator signal transducer PorX n=1 Tax=Prevotella sp. TaxID=59823 RepID=UPI002A7F3AA5|nr:bifunctional response regulator/alkaline phosphatase family protein [Prevotella sp.]MDY4644404.1 bifunctional response regulator/alkaline phosphatase family protein [Prevotella sp.]
MTTGHLLWVDDEIEMLRAHIIFLEKKGYDVTTVNNGNDAIEECRKRNFDLVLLDEMMPGITGLETLQQIKEISPSTPIVMVTKSEEENIMDQAIGQKIADYLIKPVNPSQILLALKKNIHKKQIVTEVTQTGYRKEFQDIAMRIMDCNTLDDWKDIYRRLVRWELELSSADSDMTEMLQMQKEEANNSFAKFVRKNYLSWVAPGTTQRPLMSPDIFKKCVFPAVNNGEKVFLIVIDNFRYDQWRTLAQDIGEMFDVNEDMYMSILPTATQYARNAIFSGLMPEQIERMFPDLWVDEDEEEGKNINDSAAAERLIERLGELKKNDINVVVLNFIDMLSHARTESKMVRELANNESAYRSITLSWFRHSVVGELLKALAQTDCTVIITTDHGSIRASKPIKIIGDRNTNTNLRYKLGKNLNCQSKEVFVVKNPHDAQLPAPNLSTSYVFATGNSFLAYPNNYNYYVSYYKDTFQHGGISMEEMLIPLVTLKKR